MFIILLINIIIVFLIDYLYEIVSIKHGCDYLEKRKLFKKKLIREYLDVVRRERIRITLDEWTTPFSRARHVWCVQWTYGQKSLLHICIQKQSVSLRHTDYSFNVLTIERIIEIQFGKHSTVLITYFSLSAKELHGVISFIFKLTHTIEI